MAGSKHIKRAFARTMAKYRAAQKARVAARAAEEAGSPLPTDDALVARWLKRNRPTKCAPAFLLPTQLAVR